jgi:hypothetical protein
MFVTFFCFCLSVCLYVWAYCYPCAQIFLKRRDLKAVVIDFIDVHHADLSGLEAMKEVTDSAKKNSIAVFFVNLSPEIQSLLGRAEIQGNDLDTCDKDLQAAILAAQAVAQSTPVEQLGTESLGMVEELLALSKTSSLVGLAQWSATQQGAAFPSPVPSKASLLDAVESGDAGGAGSSSHQKKPFSGIGGDDSKDMEKESATSAGGGGVSSTSAGASQEGYSMVPLSLGDDNSI